MGFRTGRRDLAQVGRVSHTSKGSRRAPNNLAQLGGILHSSVGSRTAPNNLVRVGGISHRSHHLAELRVILVRVGAISHRWRDLGELRKSRTPPKVCTGDIGHARAGSSKARATVQLLDGHSPGAYDGLKRGRIAQTTDPRPHLTGGTTMPDRRQSTPNRVARMSR